VPTLSSVESNHVLCGASEQNASLASRTLYACFGPNLIVSILYVLQQIRELTTPPKNIYHLEDLTLGDAMIAPRAGSLRPAGSGGMIDSVDRALQHQ